MASALAQNERGGAPTRAEGLGVGLEALEAMGLGGPEQSQEEVAGDEARWWRSSGWHRGRGCRRGSRPWRAEEKQEEGHGNEEGRAGSGVCGDGGLAEEGGTCVGQRSSAGRR